MSTDHPQEPALHCLIVHFGPPEPTEAAVRALLAGTQAPASIIVVDHGRDPLARRGALETPRVTIIRPNTNGGFGAGFNIGLGALYTRGAAARDLIVSLNNDVEVESDTLAQLIRWYREHPEPALIGVEVREGERRVAGGGRVSRLTGRATLNDPVRARRLDYIHGAFFAAPFEVCLRTHPMPDDYFLYWEDVAMGHNVRALGYPLKVINHITVRHHHDAPPTPLQTYYLVRNGARFMEESGSRLQRAWWYLYNRLRYRLHAVKQGADSPVAQGLRDAIRKERGPKPAAV